MLNRASHYRRGSVLQYTPVISSNSSSSNSSTDSCIHGCGSGVHWVVYTCVAKKVDP